ncbi:MAG: glycerophosphodiester phosphodiesterase [Rhodocyclaceae bacterium]|nr:glycerophosphodiester phosphodiesterase [Rhodocyclaceae bacterium]
MRPSWKLPAVVAHRCGGALAPENTLAGLEIAAALGVRGVEFDVQLSADGEPVVIHDDTLARTGGLNHRVDGLTRDRLIACDVGARHHRAFAGECLPDLARIAEACRRLGLVANVEIKCDDREGERVGAAVARACMRLWHGDPSPPLLSSFSTEALAAARAEAPDLARALLVEGVPRDWRPRTEALGCVALHCRAADLDDADVADVRASGLRIAAYTENDPARAAHWFAIGVDALFTDRPDRLMACLPAGAGHLP